MTLICMSVHTNNNNGSPHHWSCLRIWILLPDFPTTRVELGTLLHSANPLHYKGDTYTSLDVLTCDIAAVLSTLSVCLLLLFRWNCAILRLVHGFV